MYRNLQIGVNIQYFKIPVHSKTKISARPTPQNDSSQLALRISLKYSSFYAWHCGVLIIKHKSFLLQIKFHGIRLF